MQFQHRRNSERPVVQQPLGSLQRYSVWKWLVCLVIAMMATFGAQAQMAGTGAISGTVLDSSGAVVAKATVTATAVDTNVSTVRTTTSAGAYNISPLAPGVYTLTVKAKGFEKMVQENVTVNALATVAVNPKLAVGGEMETITVTDAPPVLETTDATLGAVMDNEMYSSLPLLMGAGGNADQRRATDFAGLMPGVQSNFTGTAGGGASGGNNTSTSGAVNGGNPAGGTSEIYIDGVNLPEADGVGDPRLTWTAFGVDAIDQFQVQTTGFSAQYAGQGVQNYSIKQGGNVFHGAAYEYLRNTVLDAWNPSSKHPTPVTGAIIPVGGVCTSAALTASTSWCKLGGIKSQEIMNEFGIVLSGPIIKNKLFFFYNYGQYRNQNGPKPQVQTVPTNAMMGYDPTGTTLQPVADFTGYAAATGYTIYDPSTQPMPTNGCSGAGCTRSQFTSSNQIPAARISAASAYFNKFMLPYEKTANQALYAGNIVAGYNNGLSNWYNAGRIDYDMNARNQISLIVGFGRQASTGPNAAGAANALGPPFNTSQSYAPQTNVDILKDTFTITAHLVNQFALAFGRYKSLSVTPDEEPKYAAASSGLLNTPVGQASNSFPGISFSGGLDNPNNEAGYDSNQKLNNTYALTDNMQWEHGKHNVTFGGQLVDVQFNYIKNVTNSSPLTYTFANTQTAGFTSTGTTAPNTGSAFASYMLGAVSSSSVSVGVPELGSRWMNPSFWLQDDYKITSKLTFNVGLRWDIFPSIHEAHNIFSWLNPNGQNTNTGNLGTLEFAGSKDNGYFYSGTRTPSPIWWKNLAPRLGAAYALDPKTVLRASYGLSFARGDWTSGSQSGSPSTFGLVPSASAAGGVSNAPSFYWDGTPCSNGTADSTACGWTGSVASPLSTLPAGATMAEYGAVETATLKNTNNGTVTYFDPYLGSRTPEYINWTFGIERQLTKDISLTVSYVGSEGHFINVSGANGARNNKLPESMAALAGYTLTASGGSTQTTCSGNTCLYPVLGQKATAAYLAMAASDGFTPPNPYSSTANYYASNSVYQYYQPFPQYSGVSDTTSFVGNENWNALEVSLRSRLAHGLNFMLNYTYSKSIDDIGTFRVGDNTRLDRSISTADQPQNVVGTAVYQLPLGRGHFGGSNFAYRSIVSDWSVSGIATYRSGFPILVQASGCGGSGILGTCMPSIVPGQKGRQYSYGKTASGQKVSWDSSNPNYIGSVQYINPNAFTVNIAGTTTSYGTQTGQAISVGSGPALYVPGNAPRVAPLNMWGQSAFDTDMSIKRTFPVYRTMKFQFEMAITNVTNHVIYSSPATANNMVQSATSTAFGSITTVANNPRDIQVSGRISW